MLSHYQVSKGGSNAKEMVKISLGSDTYRVDKVVGEDPEVNSDMPHEEPHNHSYNCSRNLKQRKKLEQNNHHCLTYQEHKEIPGDVPDAETQPLRPHSEEQEEECKEDHEDKPQASLDRALFQEEYVKASRCYHHLL